MKTYTAALVTLLLITSWAKAGNVESYLQLIKAANDSEGKKGTNYPRLVVDIAHQTMSDTMMFMNAMAERKGASIFCLPKNYILSGATVGDVIMSEIKAAQKEGNKEVLSNSVELYAVVGMAKSFPCNNKP